MLVGRVLIAQRPFRRPNYRDEIGRGGDVIERGPEMTNGMRQSRLRQMILAEGVWSRVIGAPAAGAAALVAALWVAICAAAPELIWQGLRIAAGHLTRSDLAEALLLGVILAFFVEPLMRRVQVLLQRGHLRAESEPGHPLFATGLSLSFALVAVGVHDALVTLVKANPPSNCSRRDPGRDQDGLYRIKQHRMKRVGRGDIGRARGMWHHDQISQPCLISHNLRFPSDDRGETGRGLIGVRCCLGHGQAVLGSQALEGLAHVTRMLSVGGGVQRSQVCAPHLRNNGGRREGWLGRGGSLQRQQQLA